MIVQMITLTDKELKCSDNLERLRIKVDGKVKFDVRDGHPTNANMCRDFHDCFAIGHLMQLAYNAGVNGEDFTLEETGKNIHRHHHIYNIQRDGD